MPRTECDNHTTGTALVTGTDRTGWLNGRPDGVKDSLRAVQFALLKAGFQQLDFGIACLRHHGKLKSQLLAGDDLPDQVGVQQQLV